MPLMTLFLPTPNTTVSMEFPSPGASKVRLIAFQVGGLTIDDPLFVSFDGLPTTSVMVGVPAGGNPLVFPISVETTAFPLLIGSFPRFYQYLNTPFPLMDGDDVVTNSHTVRIRVRDISGGEPVMDGMVLVLEYDAPDPHFARPYKQVDRREVTERVTRNVPGLPEGYNY